MPLPLSRPGRGHNQSIRIDEGACCLHYVLPPDGSDAMA